MHGRRHKNVSGTCLFIESLIGKTQAFVYMDLGGASIPHMATVTTWMEMQDSDYEYFDYRMNMTMTHTAMPGYETVECRVRYNVTAAVNEGWAPSKDVKVKSYYGQYQGVPIRGTNVWETGGADWWNWYDATYYDNGWDVSSTQGCFVQRKSKENSSHMTLKNGVGYKVRVGYKLYDQWYDFEGASMTDSGWDFEWPVYEGASDSMEFYWFDIESGAAALFAAGVSAVAFLLF